MIDKEKCPECNHDWKHHVGYGCHGSFPNGVPDHVSAEEVFYGECLCFNTIVKQAEKDSLKEEHK